MREIVESELKELEIGILNYIDNLCKENHIKYSMAYGTLLGAIRHNGFIPWDDDIDICMDRENFESFVKSCLLDNNNRYKLLWLDTCETYTLPLPKVIDTTTVLSQNVQDERMKLGVYVDVFVYDKVPNDKKKRRQFYKKLDIYQRFWGYSQNKYVWKDHTIKSYLRFLVYAIFHKFNPRIFVIKLNKISQCYRYCSEYSMLGSMLIAVNREKASYSKELFNDLIQIRFEDKEFFATSQYDEFLKQCFGDYLQLPPIEKRVSHHDFVAFYKD